MGHRTRLPHARPTGGRRAFARAAPRRGFTLIEAMVAILVLVFGLLATAGLMVRAQQAEFEAYQRKQALLIIDDITARLTANRWVADDCYAVTTDTAAGTPYLGTGNTTDFTCDTAGTPTQRARAVADLDALEALLLGAGEAQGGSDVGGLLGARACISVTGSDTAGFTFTITVAWQGAVETVAPPVSMTCGTGLYGSESRRRAVSGSVYMPFLGNS